MEKENVVYIYNGLLFRLKKEKSAICNMDKLGRHHAKWNKSDTWSPLYVESKKHSQTVRMEVTTRD